MLDYLINKGMKMKIDANEFRVPAGKKVNLAKWPTHVKPVYKSKRKYSKLLRRQVEELSTLQRLHYASNRYALLLIFQAMDAAGKDGAIRHVMSGVNPQGSEVFSFKHPSADELEHDFLWRTTRSLPERGRVAAAKRRKCDSIVMGSGGRIVRARVEPGSPAEKAADEKVGMR